MNSQLVRIQALADQLNMSVRDALPLIESAANKLQNDIPLDEDERMAAAMALFAKIGDLAAEGDSDDSHAE